MADLSQIELNGATYNLKDSVARSSKLYFASCSTAAATQTKEVTVSGVTSYYDGLNLRIYFVNAQAYNGIPKLKINSLDAVDIKRITGNNAARYEWQAGEILDFIFVDPYFYMVDGAIATTTYFGVTKLTDSLTSTGTSSAIVPNTLNKLSQNILSGLDAYNAESTYAVGDRVRYGFYFYECNTAITTAEAWNAAHWTEIDPLLTQIDALKSNKITAPTSPAEGSFLTYVNGEWTAQTLSVWNGGSY